MKYIWVFVFGAVVGFSINSAFFSSSSSSFQEELTGSPSEIAQGGTRLNDSSNTLTQIKQNIDHEKVDRVINALSTQSLSNDQSKALLQYLNSHLITLASNQNWTTLDTWLQAIEAAGLANSDIYRLQAKVWLVKKHYKKALETLFVAKDMAISQQAQQTITQEIESILNRVINAFNDQSLELSQQEFETLFLYAQQQLQEYIPVSLTLARFYQNQGKHQEALDTLSFLPYDEQYTPRVDDAQRNLEDELAQALMNEQGIPLIRSGSQFLVEVQVAQVNMVLLIDTGASYTSLSLNAIERLSNETNALSDELKRVKVNTANGSTVARVFSLSTFSLANRQAQDFSVLEVNMGDHSRSDGLLGMNFLGKYKFKIDQDNALLFLENK